MDRNLHPSLVRVYACPDEAYIAYFDETYTGVNEKGRSFYAVTVSIYRKEELEDLRADLIDIVDNLFNKGRPYWHTTEAIKTEEGKAKYEELLDYLSGNRDVSFITCQTSIRPRSDKQESSKKIAGPEENARRECFKELFGQFLNETANLQGLVFERRKRHEDNDRDKSFFNALKRGGHVPDLSRAWVSPYDEVALWIPDIVGMAYRHRLVMPSDPLGSHFDGYLADSTRVYEFDPPQ